jgi:hypothetical protein
MEWMVVGKILIFFGEISQFVDFSPKMKKYMKILWILIFICHFRNENN